MAIVKLTLSTEEFNILSENAQSVHKSIQDYIKDELIGQHSIYTPEEAVERIRNGSVNPNERFTLPDVYPQWDLTRGPAGVFGKKFFNYITDNPDLGIQFLDMGRYNRRAEYIFTRGE